MLRRLYVHNFRCLENFELPLSGQPSLLLIGKNGAGKTTVGVALEILQRIARGTNRVGELVNPKDLTRGRTDIPTRFEIEADVQGKIYRYALALELPTGFRELRVREEELAVDGAPVYTRELAEVHLPRPGQDKESQFGIDWHLVALPLVQERPDGGPLSVFKQWMARALILRPLPALIAGESELQGTLQPNPHLTDLGGWYTALLAESLSAYARVDEYLRQMMPDLKDVKNPQTGKDARNLVLQFSNQQGSFVLPFEALSDGEKCFMIFALVLASNEVYGPLLCFWDEPDSYLAPSEVGESITSVRKAFLSHGQFIATSHNPEAIRRFSDESTLVLFRKSHLEPTIARALSDVRASGELAGDLVDALVRGDVGA